jgi:hypothetical protein
MTCSSCSTWGYKSRIGDKVYPPVPYQHVQVLTAFPSQTYEQVGICSVSGGIFASGVDMYRKLQKSAALLGADAVVITGEDVSHATLPGHAYSTGSAYTTGSAYYNPYANTASGYATTTGYASTTYMPPTSVDLPNNRGIAIKYIQSSNNKMKQRSIQSSSGTQYLQ